MATVCRALAKLTLVATTAAVLVLTPAVAETYPSRPVTIVVPAAAGGGLDRVVRLLADRLRAKWDQPIVVENRGGAGGVIGTEYVAKSKPDGYVLLYAGTGQLVIDKTPKPNYDPRSFVPVSLVTTAPNVLVVNPKVKARTVQDLVALAKVAKLNFASQGIGTTQHLSVEALKAIAGIDILHVPYKGGAPALTDLIGGQVEIMFTEISGVLPHIRSGRLRALAVGSAKRNALLPDVPAISEIYPGFVSMTWQGMIAPAGTAAEIADQVSAAVAEALRAPDVAAQLKKSSLDAVGSTPADMAKFMDEERERWGKVLRAIAAQTK